MKKIEFFVFILTQKKVNTYFLLRFYDNFSFKIEKFYLLLS